MRECKFVQIEIKKQKGYEPAGNFGNNVSVWELPVFEEVVNPYLNAGWEIQGFAVRGLNAEAPVLGVSMSEEVQQYIDVLLARERKDSKFAKCPKCGALQKVGSVECYKCGTKMQG